MKLFNHGFNTEEQKTSNLEEITSIPSPGSIRKLTEIRNQSLPVLEALIADMNQKTGLFSEKSLKSSKVALEKSRRPETLAKYPWFSVCHLRDFLRFRTHLHNLDDFAEVLKVFQSWERQKQISIVKVDTQKLLRPGLFGWRMAAVDIRIVKTGMIVEHYMTFADLIQINENWLHKIYEHWRQKDMSAATTGMTRAFYRDREFCKYANREIFMRRACNALANGSHLQKIHSQNWSSFYAEVQSHLS